MNPSEYIDNMIASQREVHENLLELAAEQEEALRSSDVDALNRIVSKQTVAIMQLGRIERERQQKIDLLCSTLGLSPTVTLSELIAELPEPDRSRLSLDARALRTLIGEVQQANRRNSDLISFERDVIDQFVKGVILQSVSSAIPTQSRLVDVEA